MSTELYFMAHGMAPSASKVACIDFDQTLYPRTPLFAQPDPLPGAVEAVCRLKEAGYRIVILTSRLSPTWLAEAKLTDSDMRDYIEAVLKRDGIPFDLLTSEKVAAEVYVDDRAIRFRDGEWAAIVDWILWSGDEPK